jgi:MarR family transcriptional regulator, 2-MHQ and catechol-resistance regulon repressor
MPTKYQGTEIEKKALNAYINLLRASETITHEFDSRLQSEDGMTMSELGILDALKHFGSLQPKEISIKILKTKGNVSFHLKSLLEKKWIKKNESKLDARSYSVSLTRIGEKIIEKAFKNHTERIVTRLSVLSFEEQEMLRNLCRRVGKRPD